MTKQTIEPIISQLEHFLDENHAIDIVSIDVKDQTTVTSYMMVCSGRSSRQVKAIADHTIQQMKSAGHPVYAVSGLEKGEWVLIDFGVVVLHVMQPDTRAFYHIEGLWQPQAE